MTAAVTHGDASGGATHYQGERTRDAANPADDPTDLTFGFDDAEGEAFEEGHVDMDLDLRRDAAGEPAFSLPPEEWHDGGGEQAPRHDADGGDVTRTIRRRLSRKTTPAAAAASGYPQAPHAQPGTVALGTRAEATAARRRATEFLRKHRADAAAARETGWASVRRAPEHTRARPDVEALEDGPLEASIPKAWEVHSSHEAKRAPQAEIVYCANCGAWSSGHKARGLTIPCRGPVGHRGNLRLLSLGIAPVRGARIPAELKVLGTRGTRGGYMPAPRAGWRGKRR